MIKIQTKMLHNIPFLTNKIDKQFIVIEFANCIYVPVLFNNDVYLLRYNKCYHVQLDFETINAVTLTKCKKSKSTRFNPSWCWTNLDSEYDRKVNFATMILPFVQNSEDGFKFNMLFHFDDSMSFEISIDDNIVDSIDFNSIKKVKS